MMRGVAALLLTESETKDMSRVRATCDAWIVGALAPPVVDEISTTTLTRHDEGNGAPGRRARTRGVEDASGGDRVGGGHRRITFTADRGRERAVERGPRTRHRRHDLDVVVVAPHDPAPPRARLRAPLIAERARRVAGDERRLLSVHRAVDDIGRLGAGHAEPRSRRRLPPTPPVVRPGTARVGERDEHVVVEAVVADVPFGVDRVDRTEDDQRLVDEVAPEVEQRAATGRLRTTERREPFEAALEPRDVPEPPALDEVPECEEVGVPPPVLVRREHEPPLRRQLHRTGSRGGVQRERLVAHDVQTERQRFVGERAVGVGGRRDRHRFGTGGRERLQRVERGNVRVVGGDERAAFRRGGDDAEEVTRLRARQQRSVEDPTPEAVAGESDAQRFGHARGVSQQRTPR